MEKSVELNRILLNLFYSFFFFKKKNCTKSSTFMTIVHVILIYLHFVIITCKSLTLFEHY